MTNQQLKAHCEDVIANPQDHLDWVVDMARVALASLEAVPFGYCSEDATGKDVYSATIWIDKEDAEKNSFGLGLVEVFTAQPGAELKLPDPINWKEAQTLLNVNQCGEDRFEAFRMGANWQLDEIKRLNGVKS